MAISGSLPTTDSSWTTLLRSRSNVGPHKDSSLQLPHKMDVAFSIRQLHWIIKPNSPRGSSAAPSRRVPALGVRRPNSRKIAEPYPRHRWDKGRLTSASRNVCKALATSLLKPGSPFQQRAPASAPKSCGQLLGESWPRANRSGTGRGGDVTGSRVPKFLLFSDRRGRWRSTPPGVHHRARPRRWDRSATGA